MALNFFNTVFYVKYQKEHGAAYEAGGLEVGQLILAVDGHRVEGMQHQDVARLIAESFAQRDKPVSTLSFTTSPSTTEDYCEKLNFIITILSGHYALREEVYQF